MAREMINEGLKVRQVSSLLEIPRTTIYYQSSKGGHDDELAHLIEGIAFKHTFYGYRRIHLALRKQGREINHKKVYRIYRGLNLQRKRPRKKKKTLQIQLPLTEPGYPNHVWAVDFLFDSIKDGRLIKLMPVEDLFSRFSPGIDIQFSIPSERVVEFLEECFRICGKPEVIRTDQGPEFRGKAFERFLERQRIRHEFTEKGSPWQNGDVESFIGKLRDECLNRNLFKSLDQAKEVVKGYRKFYNIERPHSSLNGKVPYEEYKGYGL